MSEHFGSNKLPGIESNHRQRIISKFKDEILSYPELSVGFSLFWIWLWIVFQNDLLTSTLHFESPYIPPWTVPLLAYAFGFFVLGGLFRQKRIVPHGKIYLFAIVFCMTAGALILTVFGVWEHEETTLLRLVSLICGFLMGLGTAGLHVEWGRVFGSRGVHAIIIHGIAGTLGAAILYSLLQLLPPLMTCIWAICIPSLCMLSLQKTLRANPRLHKYGAKATLYIPWKFIVTSLIHGVSFGAMWTVLMYVQHEGSFMTINALSFAVSAIAVFVSALLFRMNFNHLIYHVAFPIMALSYAMLAILGGSVIVGSTLNSIGVHFLSLLLWTLCVYLIKNQGISANWVFTWTTGSYILGQALGALLGTFSLVYSDSQPDGLFILAIIMVFIILASALFMVNNNNLKEGWGLVKPGEDETKVDGLELACDLISKEYSLTARERDILSLLARGRNRTFISQELIIAENTIKTHIRNIYQKTNVHSQQELMSLVDKKVKLFTGEDANVPTTAF
ncbi:MAG: response regulator transcription factor [Raoultibacter sp.]|jgi:DNA-binding CsgD family transcriptional regulator